MLVAGSKVLILPFYLPYLFLLDFLLFDLFDSLLLLVLSLELVVARLLNLVLCNDCVKEVILWFNILSLLLPLSLLLVLLDFGLGQDLID